VPIVHPVLEHDYTVGQPILGGEVSIHSNLTSLTRDSAAFDPITSLASANNLCSITSPDPASKTATNCLLRGIPGTYHACLVRGELAENLHRPLW